MTDQTPSDNSFPSLGTTPPMGSTPPSPPPPRPPAPLNIGARAIEMNSSRFPSGRADLPSEHAAVANIANIAALAAVAAVAALAAVAIGVTVAIAAGDEASSMPPITTATAALVEDDSCSQDDDLSGARPGTTVARPGTQQLTVSVPAIAVITNDPAGHVTSVMTNTGCAPRSDNQIWQTSTDSGLTEGTWADIEHIDFVGDFTQAGTHVSQQPDPH